MATPRTDQEILLDKLRKAIESVEVNTDGLEVQTGGKFSTGSRGISVDGTIEAIAINSEGQTVVAPAAGGSGAKSNLAMRVCIATDDIPTALVNTNLAAIETTNNANQVLLTSIKTAVEALDNAVSGSEMQVDLVASLPAGANVIGGVVLAAGTASIGTLAANSGVDIGDVDVKSVSPGHASTSLGKREDDPHVSTDTGIFCLAVRQDTLGCFAQDGDYTPFQVNHDGELYITDLDNKALLTTLAAAVQTEDLAAGSGDKGILTFAVRSDAGSCAAQDGDYVALQVNHDGYLYTQSSAAHKEDDAAVSGDKGIMALAVRKDVAACLAQDGDYQPLQVDTDGTVRTQNTFGQWGTILVTDTTQVTCGVSDRDFVAIYMLTNTTFASGAGGLSAKTDQLYLDDTFTSTAIDADAGTPIDGITFPAGMTLYGRYTGFTLGDSTSSVIAYVG